MSYPPVAAGLLHAALFDELDAGDTPPVSASQLSQVPPLGAPEGQVGMPAQVRRKRLREKTSVGDDSLFPRPSIVQRRADDVDVGFLEDIVLLPEAGAGAVSGWGGSGKEECAKEVLCHESSAGTTLPLRSSAVGARSMLPVACWALAGGQ